VSAKLSAVIRPKTFLKREKITIICKNSINILSTTKGYDKLINKKDGKIYKHI